MADPIRINALPNEDSPLGTDVLPLDSTTGGTVRSVQVSKLVQAGFKDWFSSLPTDPTGLASGDFWNNGGSIAQVP